MSADYTPTEAEVEAAARAINPKGWDPSTPIEGIGYVREKARSQARAALIAAPEPREDVAEQIAQAIEAEADGVDWDLGFNADAYLNGLTFAARTARTFTPAPESADMVPAAAARAINPKGWDPSTPIEGIGYVREKARSQARAALVAAHAVGVGQ